MEGCTTVKSDMNETESHTIQLKKMGKPLEENDSKNEPESYTIQLQKMVEQFLKDDFVKLLTVEFGGDAMEYVVKKICEYWGIKEVDFIQTSLQVLFMLQEDLRNLQLSDLLHKVLVNHAETAVGNSTKMHGKIIAKANIPENFNALRDLIEKAAVSKQQIKAVGTKYSGLWTDIGDSNGMIIDTSRLEKELTIPFLEEKYKDARDLKCFEAGITMYGIQNKLWPIEERSNIKQEHRVLKHVTNGADLSLAGTVTTGAHGNGLNTGIVADAVVSFKIFTIDKDWKVKMFQIEKTDGITNRQQFEEHHKDQNVKLIQNDEVFKASVVNIGCMGVVYSYVLKTDPAFYLEEERKIYKWCDAKQKIQELYHDESVYNFQVIGSPYAYRLSPRETAEHRVLISILKTTNKHPKERGERSRGHMNLPMGYLDKALVAIGNSNPHMIPVIMHVPLMFLEHDTIVLNAVEALNTLSGVVSKEFSGVRSSECAMRSDGPETVIEIMEDLHELYSDIRKSNNRQLVNVPTALRFTAKSDKYMAMGYDCQRPTITIEQSIISGTLGADDTLKKFRKRMLKNFHGRPHWGLLHELDAEKIKRLYGGHCRKKFTSALNYFDPKFVFENNFANWVFGEERRNNKESLLPPEIHQSQMTPTPTPLDECVREEDPVNE